MKGAHVLGILILAVFGFLGWLWWRDRRMAEQAEVCWRYFGSDDILRDKTEECLVLRYGWRQDEAWREALDQRSDFRTWKDSAYVNGELSDPVQRERDSLERIGDSIRAALRSQGRWEESPRQRSGQ